MDLKYFQNKGEDTFELLLHGEVGQEIDGREIASEIHMLNTMGAKIIKERINTIGGSVMHAFSIVSANLSSNAEIHTFNEGVADSSGSFILASGTHGKRGAFDFSTMKVHNTSHNGVMLEDMEDGNLKKELIMMRDSIVTILANNSGQDASQIREMMNQGKRMDAKEAKKLGFIDFIETSVNKPALTENMSLTEIMNTCHDLNNKPEKKMDTLFNYLKLSQDASEGSVLTSVQNISKRAEDAESKNGTLIGEIANLNTDVSEKDAKIKELETIVNESKVKEIKNAVDSAISSGKFDEDSREKLTGQANVLGIDNFTEMIGMVKLPHVDVAGQVQNKKLGGSSENKEKELAEKYQKMAEEDPGALADIQNKSPKEFEEMFNAWDKQ